MDSSRLLNFAALDAVRADLHALGRAFYQSANALQVDVPASLGDIVSVADSIAELRTAATEFTGLRHETEISLR